MAGWPERKNEALDVGVAYDAMRAFLEIWWRQGNCSEDEIAGLLGSLNRGHNTGPLDPALWDDWLKAVDVARAGAVGTPPLN
jgi:hypothetical protein